MTELSVAERFRLAYVEREERQAVKALKVRSCSSQLAVQIYIALSRCKSASIPTTASHRIQCRACSRQLETKHSGGGGRYVLPGQPP